jgi:plastocyanin
MSAATAVAVLVAACSGNAAGAAPVFTYAPAAPSTSTDPMAGMDMSPSASPSSPSTAPTASGPASAVPVPAGSPAGSPAAAGSPAGSPAAAGSPVTAGATLHIAAMNIAFDTDHLEAPAGQGFVLEFANNDPGVPHNVEIKNASGASMFKGQIITGPAKMSYQVPALAAGSYMFLCDVHPNMTGTLTVS